MPKPYLVYRFSLILLIGIVLLGGDLLRIGFRNQGMVSLIQQNALHQVTFSLSKQNNISEKSNKWFEYGLNWYPLDSRIVRGRAYEEWISGNELLAIKTLEKYQQLESNDQTTNLILGDWLYIQGETNQALDYWSSTRGGIVLIDRVNYVLNDDQLDVAGKLLSFILHKSRPSYSLSYLVAQEYSQIATYYKATGDMPNHNLACNKASSAYEMAIKYKPDLGFVYINFAALLKGCGNIDKALEKLQMVDSTFNTTTQAWANHDIGLLYLQLAQPQNAIPYLEQAVSFDSEQPGYKSTLLKTYQQSVILFPEREQYKLQLAIFLIQEGEIYTAQSLFQEITESPNEYLRKQALDRLEILNAEIRNSSK